MEKKVDTSEIEDILVDFFKAPPFRVLHLSDLHFDSSCTIDENYLNTIISLKDKLKEIKEDMKFDFAVFTGDIANKDVSNDHLQALSHLNEIRNILFEGEPERFLIVPGNHDCIWENYDSPERKLQSHSWDSYLRLWTQFYGKTDKFGDTYPEKEFMIELTSDDLSWHLEFKEPDVSIIGISSTITSPEQAGKGVATKKKIDFIKKYWKGISGEKIRILLLHHNLFPTISTNQKDEKLSILNLGDLLDTLSNSNCKIVLSGHTHNSNLIKLRFTEFFDCEEKKPYEIVSITAGSCCGGHPAKDRKKTFNIIEVGYNKSETISREIRVTPYIYNSMSNKWIRSNFELKDELS